MIARILYRESVHGVLNYVLHKPGCKILGFMNTSLEMQEQPELFKHYLHFMGNRHETKKRYAHITINLPHGEFLTDKNFHKLAIKYMEHMGYAEQPFVVVRHDDTKHEHIHIVTTTIKEDNSIVNLSNDYRRNLATQKYLENEFGLEPSPESNLIRELPIFRLPEKQPLPDDSEGVKFYIQDILNTVIQKYRVRSFEELSRMVKPYHILISHRKNENGRVGVSYGIEVNKGYKSRFINGYIVHPSLSGPKMESIFQRNSKSKLLPMHRKRLEKQILTAYKLFKNIKPENLLIVLKEYQNIDGQLHYNKKLNLTGLTIYDKSGYVFESSEINKVITANLKLSENRERKTSLNIKGNQFVLEIRKLIKEAFYSQYLNSYKKDRLLSEFILTKNCDNITPQIMQSQRFAFLSHYMDGKDGMFLKAVEKEFEATKNLLHITEIKKEVETLKKRVDLMKGILRNPVLGFSNNNEVLFELVQSLGTKYSRGQISYINSNTHYVPLPIGALHLPNENSSYVSTGFINENEKVLKCLIKTEDADEKTIRANAMFLPIIFPKLYASILPQYRQRYEQLALKAYLGTAEKFHAQFEKSPSDYIKMFNAKGFYFQRIENEVHINSIYTKRDSGVHLPKKTQAYLKSLSDLDTILEDQHQEINLLKENGRDKLQNLWAAYLIERGLYDKAAFLIVYDGIRPNISSEAIEYHMGNGLREKILLISKQKINSQHRLLLRKSIYAFSALMGKTNTKEEEVFNGFRDELTDYSKYKNVFI